ncbi:HAMP domain-containing sensor histidine kinase [Spongiactinospora sp. TRM90649]|uniref:sensor histidine kinase n=1 Tax=Spongiactinospora sp. TRM90649 TaxID=3031114 RepID=UPI0023F93BEF|nr:HAMP domain-containing sensor histidine kinase [Spongiactinospora sp. TRM90649]MDF5755578.1 HAMP domain-containing sensor histidine kinase [Spongiactinospora sp. TRM90649]
MSVTGSSRTSRLLTVGWAASAVINLGLMYAFPDSGTVPFHLVWIGLSLIYGFVLWSPLAMILVLCSVTLSTGAVLVRQATDELVHWEEVTEVPLMSAVFAVMVWHVRSRQVALDQVRRMAEAERRHAERRHLFVRLASHELRTPITVARGYAELVSGAVDDAARADLAIVVEELDKLARISQRLVTLMRVDDEHRLTVGDVDAAVARIVRRWEPTAPRDWSVRTSVGRMPFNEERLEAALDSLLENAVRFTGEGDSVAVAAFVEGTDWVVEVADSGVGMTPERAAELTTALEPPLPTSTGSGLGLAIARTVVEAWGGELLVSGRPGAGTVVTLRVPIPGDGRDGLSTSAASMSA